MKDSLAGIGFVVGYLTVFFGWVYNVVWILDNWAHLSTIAKVIDIMSVFFFPLGALFGIIHFLGG